MKGSIYFLQAEVSRHIKIGYSSRPAARIKGLQTASPYKMNVLGCMRGSREDEANLHRLFAGSRVVGEWFEPTDALLEYISYNAEALPKAQKYEDVAADEVLRFLQERAQMVPSERGSLLTGQTKRSFENVRQAANKISVRALVNWCRNDPDFAAAFIEFIGFAPKGSGAFIGAMRAASIEYEKMLTVRAENQVTA